MFAFVGIEVALIPSGEVKNPTRTVPRSAYLALVITTIIYILIQLVAQGTLGADLANYKDAPLAEAAAKFLGDIGRTILLAGATISAFGFVTSDILSSPRMIFAFGRDGVLPAWFAHVHPRYRSPDVAIITYAVLAFALSITGTFEQLAVLSNVAVLLMYLLCCAACWFLVQRDVRADGQPFNFPGMKIIPALAIIAIVWILAHATVWEFEVNAIVLGVASLLYFIRVKLRAPRLIQVRFRKPNIVWTGQPEPLLLVGKACQRCPDIVSSRNCSRAVQACIFNRSSSSALNRSPTRLFSIFTKASPQSLAQTAAENRTSSMRFAGCWRTIGKPHPEPSFFRSRLSQRLRSRLREN